MTFDPDEHRVPPQWGPSTPEGSIADPLFGFDATPVAVSGPLRPRRRRKRVRRWLLPVVLVAVVAGLIALAPWDPQRRQLYDDQWVVWTQPPSAEIEQLADELHLTDAGRRIFFASLPQIDEAADFEQHCPLEGDVVLGCYTGGHIYIYDVTDDRLSGTIETTAAHELLHAVYERMSPSDLRQIDALVAGYVATLSADDNNVATVADYPSEQHPDEWHSRLGTDYADLPAALEEHYATYFGDRSRVLAYSTGSTEQLDGYTNRIDQLSAELEAAADDLDRRSEAYDTASEALETAVDNFNRRADAGLFPSQEAFSAERSELLRRQDELERDRVRLNADIDRYNAKVAELETLDSERAELFSHLDSRSAAE